MGEELSHKLLLRFPGAGSHSGNQHDRAQDPITTMRPSGTRMRAGRTCKHRGHVLQKLKPAVVAAVDAWSDLDAMIIMADDGVNGYYASAAWLAPFGRLIGAERHERPWAKSLRVCYEKRSPLLLPSVQSAKRSCQARINGRE